MPTIQTREIEDLTRAHICYREKENDATVRALVIKTASVLCWTPEIAKIRGQELLWEIGLLLCRGIRLSEEIFLRYATSVHENGSISMALRP